MGPEPTPLQERYILNSATGCWEFTGHRTPDGYGRVRHDGKAVGAHRLAAHLWLGFDLSSTASVLHSCDNPPCINPAHLRPGTPADNARDMVERGRQFIPGVRGEQHWNAKLSEDDVREIRRLALEDRTFRSIAEHFGVSAPTISRIVNGKRRVV